MEVELFARRRFLLLCYQRYMVADAAWRQAQGEAHRWFPRESRVTVFAMGNPGSPLRRLYERRERALRQLEAARLKLEVGRERLARARDRAASSVVLQLSVTLS